MKFRKSMILFLALLLLCACSPQKESIDQHYAIVRGMKVEKVMKIKKNYDLLVIEGSHFNKKQIQALHHRAKKIYSYIDIAATKNKKYQRLFLGKTISGKKYYLNVNDVSWQKHMLEMTTEQKSLGIDGFFFDHLDIYEHYPSTYQGLVSIIQQTSLPIMVNNAMAFMEKDSTSFKKKIHAINQENLFTYWNHQSKKRENVSKQESDNLKIYLDNMKQEGYSIYLVDFTKKSDWHAVIKSYCKKHHFTYYLSPNTNYSK